MSPFNFICDAESVDIHRRTGNYFTTQRYKDANALYAFKSRGFGGEIGLVTANTTSIGGLSDILCDNISQSFGNGLEHSARINR